MESSSGAANSGAEGTGKPYVPPEVVRRRRIRGWIWPVALAGVIFALSSQSVLPGPSFPYVDKLEHFCVYGLLATLVCRLGRGWRAAAWALAAVSLYGVTDEVHQYFVPGRSSDVFDWMADTLGAAAGVTLYVGWRRYRSLLEQPLLREPPPPLPERTGA